MLQMINIIIRKMYSKSTTPKIAIKIAKVTP